MFNSNVVVEVEGKFAIVWEWMAERDFDLVEVDSARVFDTRAEAVANLKLSEEVDSWAGSYSDAYKDAFGFRDRSAFKEGTTLAQQLQFYKTEMERLEEIIARQIEQEKKEQAENVIKFEAQVTKVMEICNCDREAAIKHIMVADNCQSQDELEYVYNLPWRYVRGPIAVSN